VDNLHLHLRRVGGYLAHQLLPHLPVGCLVHQLLPQLPQRGVYLVVRPHLPLQQEVVYSVHLHLLPLLVGVGGSSVQLRLVRGFVAEYSIWHCNSMRRQSTHIKCL
jgi:hypothetical protein